MIPADAPGALFWAAAATALAVSALWWSAVTLFFAMPAVAGAYRRIRRHADLAMGGILILLGLKLVVIG
jgi:threonine/homoserine/homoserine lactone efflux protein